ncbi:MAG: MBL fold metallo-hydrolase [Candidatus Pacebacteria bacterium]|nr:MBL fold metallo-hydrolase [Candidatus Paceibacterota bacterium]
MREWVTFLVLVALNIVLFSIPTPQGLTVTFFDVGQGDSILIEGPTGVQVLVDAGADTSALRGLGAALPFWDRTLDAVIATHPDQDHIGGMADVLERYDVGRIIDPGVEKGTRAWEVTLDAIRAEVEAGASRTTARAGQRLDLGGGAYADILYPTKDVSRVKDTNAGSVVMRVVYGETSVMLTGDAPSKVEQELFLKWGYGLDSDVLKAGHHGSKTSSLPDFVDSVSPEYVVFSRGCDNRYGHPAPSVVSYFESLNVKILDTCEDGTVTFSSDGLSFR